MLKCTQLVKYGYSVIGGVSLYMFASKDRDSGIIEKQQHLLRQSRNMPLASFFSILHSTSLSFGLFALLVVF